MAAPTPELALRLSERIRRDSMALHRETSGGTFLQALFDGSLEPEGYSALLSQLWFVYRRLEQPPAAVSKDPVVGAFLDPDLARLSCLEHDLTTLVGPAWAQEIAPSPATTAYLERLDAVSHSWPGGFLAHHYVRYLGDLSGGQAIGAAVMRAFDLTVERGARFYVFTEITDRAAYKDTYRAAIDAAAFDLAEQERISAEVLLAYDLNAALLDELAPQRFGGGR